MCCRLDYLVNINFISVKVEVRTFECQALHLQRVIHFYKILFSFCLCRTALFLHARKSFGKLCEKKEDVYGTCLELKLLLLSVFMFM